MTDPMAQALSQLTSALDQLHIRYLVGGSLASSAHGVFRATLDGDLVAAISPAHAKPLAKALGPAWYVEAWAARLDVSGLLKRARDQVNRDQPL